MANVTDHSAENPAVAARAFARKSVSISRGIARFFPDFQIWKVFGKK
jgi:hypothetical protein